MTGASLVFMGLLNIYDLLLFRPSDVSLGLSTKSGQPEWVIEKQLIRGTIFVSRLSVATTVERERVGW